VNSPDWEQAVLGAAAGFQADDALDLDLGAAPAHPDLVREGEQLVQLLVGQPEHGKQLLRGQSLAPLEHLLTGVARISAARTSACSATAVTLETPLDGAPAAGPQWSLGWRPGSMLPCASVCRSGLRAMIRTCGCAFGRDVTARRTINNVAGV